MQVNMKYAHIEQERRYLLQSNTSSSTPLRELFIRDRYLLDSTLRLRRVEEAGKPTVFKFGQKIRVGNDFQFRIAHTTMYISEEEFDVLTTLPSKKLEKRRSIFPLEDLQFALDEFEGELAGLLLVEIDFGSKDTEHNELPFEGLIEVTRDERFTGGKLASATAEDLRSLLMEYGVN